MDNDDQSGLDPVGPATTKAQYFHRWSQLHGGVDASASKLIKIWLTFAYSLARPMTRVGMSPNSVTALGLIVAGCVPLLAWLGAREGSSWWLLAAVFVTVLTGLLDNLDGAVAVISGRTTRWGYVLDSIADRLSDAALLAALWAVGAPGPLVVVAGLLGATQEYARARAAAAGVSEVGVVSVSERPTRVIIVSVFLLLAAWAPYGLDKAGWATIGAWAAFGVALVGALQVFVALRKRLD